MNNEFTVKVVAPSDNFGSADRIRRHYMGKALTTMVEEYGDKTSPISRDEFRMLAGEFAKEAGLHVETVRKYCRGVFPQVLPGRGLAAFLRVLGITFEELMDIARDRWWDSLGERVNVIKIEAGGEHFGWDFRDDQTRERWTKAHEDQEGAKKTLANEVIRRLKDQAVMTPPMTVAMEPVRKDPEDTRRQVQMVTLPNGLCVADVPVPQHLYKDVMGKNPSYFSKGRPNNPVENVSWYEAVRFCNKLSETVGFSPAYTITDDVVIWDRTSHGYRLPTEEEWEYLARAGSEGDYRFGNDETQLEGYAWYDANSGGRTQPVGEKKPNAWGIYDVHGNVWEWCWDEEGSYRVYRGGSWFNTARYARVANRSRRPPGDRNYYLGFRLVCGPEMGGGAAEEGTEAGPQTQDSTKWVSIEKHLYDELVAKAAQLGHENDKQAHDQPEVEQEEGAYSNLCAGIEELQEANVTLKEALHQAEAQNAILRGENEKLKWDVANLTDGVHNLQIDLQAAELAGSDALDAMRKSNRVLAEWNSTWNRWLRDISYQVFGNARPFTDMGVTEAMDALMAWAMRMRDPGEDPNSSNLDFYAGELINFLRRVQHAVGAGDHENDCEMVAQVVEARMRDLEQHREKAAIPDLGVPLGSWLLAVGDLARVTVNPKAEDPEDGSSAWQMLQEIGQGVQALIDDNKALRQRIDILFEAIHRLMSR